jgi:hypothetical protein
MSTIRSEQMRPKIAGRAALILSCADVGGRRRPERMATPTVFTLAKEVIELHTDLRLVEKEIPRFCTPNPPTAEASSRSLRENSLNFNGQC